MEKRILKIMITIFLCLGIALLLGSATLFYLSYQRVNTWKETEATITKITRNQVFITYTANGEVLERPTSNHSGDRYEGKQIRVWVNPDDIGAIYEKEFEMAGYVLFAVGVVFVLVAICFWVITKPNSKKAKKLMETGELIYAEIDEILINRTLSVNGRSPYYISCRWKNPANGAYYLFRSGNLWFHPGKIIEEKNIKALPVYIEPDNPRNYYVKMDDFEVNDYR